MKIPVQSPRQRQQGTAVIVALAILAILLLYVSANIRSLYNLGIELKAVERRQVHRLNARAGTTNFVAVEFSTPRTNTNPIGNGVSQPLPR